MSVSQTAHHRLQLGRAQAHIRTHVGQSLSLDELARLAGASRYHFVRLFSAYAGETPFSYVRRQRVLVAMERIQATLEAFTAIGIGVSWTDTTSGLRETHRYRAAVTTSRDPGAAALTPTTISGGTYLSFILTGSHKGIWPAFSRAFKVAEERGYALREQPCLEIYLNNPAQTPEEQLRTQLLLPVKPS